MTDTAPVSQRVPPEPDAPDASEESPASGPEARAAAAPRQELAGADLPQALLGAWFIVACVNLTVMLALAPAQTRFQAYSYAFGHLLALGVLSSGVTLAFRRWVSARALWGFVALGVAALALAFGILDNDFANFSAKQAEEEGSAIPWAIILPAVTAAATVAASVVASLLARTRYLRWLCLPLGAALAVVSQVPLFSDYPGLRLFALWNAANLLAVPLLGVRLPLPPRARTPWVVRAVLGAYALPAIVSVIWPPRPSVARALLRAPGSVLSPQLARLRPELSKGAASKFAKGEWFEPRDDLPPIPPSKPSLLPKDPLVFFLTIDAARGDLFIGDKYRDSLPVMLGLRDKGVSFEMARSPSPATAVSVTAMFTGRFYSLTYWHRTSTGLISPEKEMRPRLAEHLSAAGVQTMFIVNAHGTAKRGGARGFERVIWQKRSFGPAKGAMDLMLKELKRGTNGPMFVYSHFAEPHYPYNRAGKHRGSPFANYLAEVANVDKEIGRLIDFLESKGLSERAVFIISADHGEAFGEHGQNYHAFSNYDEVVHVPLIFYVPGVPHRIVKDPVSVIDVRPTLLDLFGLDTPATDMGQSLVPYLRGQNPKLTRPLVVESGTGIQAMVFPDNIKIMRNKKTRVVEAYDLNKDPGEQNDLMDDPSFDSKPYENALARYFEVHTREGYDPPLMDR